MRKQIFISYRRDGGDVMAKMLNDRLVDLGYDVFYDIESLKSGAFDTKLYEEIEGCDDFILILPKNGLNNCVYEGDWVRCEVRHALKHKKNIIPVFLRDFAFPMNMPDDINPVRTIQGVDFTTMEYFDSRVEKIVDMLVSKPVYAHVRADKVAKIYKITAYGTNGTSTTPSDRLVRYNTINMEEYENVCFKVEVNVDKFNMPKYSLIVVDDMGIPIYDSTGIYSVNEGDTDVIITWKIKEKGYPLVAPGKYRVSIGVENSEQCVAGIDIILKPLTKEERERSGKVGISSGKKVTNVESSLSYPKGGKLAGIYGILMLITQYLALPVISYGEESLMLAAVAVILLDVIFFFKLLKYTKKYVFNSLIVSIIALCPIICYIYSIYLVAKGRECKKICVNHSAIEKKISSIMKAEN